VFVDYDNVRFHLSTPERKTVLLLSMNIRCWDELVQYGALEVLQREYGPLLSNQTEPDYNVSLQIDLEQAPVDQGRQLRCVSANQYTDLNIDQSPERHLFSRLRSLNAMQLQLLLNAHSMPRRNWNCLEAQGELMQIHYRDEEAIFIQAAPDRVTVIFSTVFREETDRIFGKVFLQVRDF
jgi:actin related protein 2/3 complex subunit 2